jgi:hypothetical protein
MVRITVQLIRVFADEHLWAETSELSLPVLSLTVYLFVVLMKSSVGRECDVADIEAWVSSSECDISVAPRHTAPSLQIAWLVLTRCGMIRTLKRDVGRRGKSIVHAHTIDLNRACAGVLRAHSKTSRPLVGTESVLLAVCGRRRAEPRILGAQFFTFSSISHPAYASLTYAQTTTRGPC